MLGLGGAASARKAEEHETKPVEANEPANTSSTQPREETAETVSSTDLESPEMSPQSATEEQGSKLPEDSKSPKDNGEAMSPASPEKGDSKVKSWLKSRFRRSTNAGSAEEEKTFVGGAALTGAGMTERQSSEKARDDSMREVAMAGKTEPEDMYGASDREAVSPPDEKAESAALGADPSISSLSSSDEEQQQEQGGKDDSNRGRRGFRERFLKKPLGKTTTQESASDNQDAEFEEARDTFDEGPSLAPPPKLTKVMSGGSGKPTSSPVRDSRFSEEFGD